MLVAFPVISWKFLDGNNYANKNDQKKIEGKNSYYDIVTLENVRAYIFLLKCITKLVTLSPENFSGNHLPVQIITLIHQIIIFFFLNHFFFS